MYDDVWCVYIYVYKYPSTYSLWDWNHWTVKPYVIVFQQNTFWLTCLSLLWKSIETVGFKAFMSGFISLTVGGEHLNIKTWYSSNIVMLHQNWRSLETSGTGFTETHDLYVYIYNIYTIQYFKDPWQISSNIIFCSRQHS